MERRQFFSRTAVLAASPLLVGAARPTAAGLIDTNVSLGDWPVRRSWVNSPADLARKLQTHGVTSAWVGSFASVLQTDVAGANARLANACAEVEGGKFLSPFGTVNPTLPDWEDDIRRCHEGHRMAGLRLFPNYHGYALDDPRFVRLVALATERRLVIQIALALEDDRSQNPILTAAPVAAAPLADLLAKIPAARVMLLNASSRVLGPGNPLLLKLAKAGVYFETATLEGVAGIESLLQKNPNLRLTFGSHTPYFYFESALLKLQESQLTPAQLAAVSFGHAQAALAP